MSLMLERLRRLLGRLAGSWKVFAVVGLLVGLTLAPYAYSTATERDATVAVIPLEGGIDGPNAAGVAAQLAQARADGSIQAVVLLSNSPGGSASASETLYMEVARTAEQMPVVGHVDAMAASGAYYALAPTDHINGKPSSLVGSVGVYVTTPTDPQPLDGVIASGSDKLSGGDQRDWMHKTESLRRAFVGAVFEHRGDRLDLTREELSDAGIYTGAEAVENGLMDGIGSVRDSIREAAERADLHDYDVEVLRADRDGNASTKFVTRTNYVASEAPNKELVSPSYFVGNLGEDPAMPTIVMLPSSVVVAGVDADDVATSDGDGVATSDWSADEADDSEKATETNETATGDAALDGSAGPPEVPG